MLQIRNVTKVYHSKAGNSVKALDNVSMTFPENGMVFILGKSGSGKSTLLNVIGGLDGYDSGEFIIKGKSSKDFAGSDFDAYRNTFIGFIFQEYNILDDFTVGANIGLALELQGKKATSEKISSILAQVDMLDYAKRKPNELSGGQKQRIAIARALVKDPEIIMADEPTGALDSNTGKQIFDTLKELSRNKLVIVVSHDRDFAEKYGDRIIEMKDGQIFSDVTKHEVEAKAISSGILQMNDNLLRIEQGYQLTANDVVLINEYLKKQNAEILISGDRRLNDNVRSVAGISSDNRSSVFDDTDEKKDIAVKDYSGANTKFIRSRLPMKNALKMGSSSLGHKKFRLVMTVFLSLIAFSLFGFADSLGAYDKITTATDSIIDSHIQNASFSLGVKHTYVYSDGDSHSYTQSAAMNDEDLRLLREKTGIQFVPVFNGSQDTRGGDISLMNAMISTSAISDGSAYTGALYGMTAADEMQMNRLGFTVYGKMPTEDNQIAISKFMVEQFNLTGFQNTQKGEKIAAGSVTYDDNGSTFSILGKHLSFNLNGYEHVMEITAVIDTNFEYDRYADYIPSSDSSQAGNSALPDEDGGIMDMIMEMELQNTLRYGFHCLGYITQDKLNDMAERIQSYGNQTSLGTRMNWSAGLMQEGDDSSHGFSLYLEYVADSSALSSMGEIQWLDGVSRTSLGENEMVVSNTILSNLNLSTDITQRLDSLLDGYFGGIESYELWKTAYADQREGSLLVLIRNMDWHIDKYRAENGLEPNAAISSEIEQACLTDAYRYLLEGLTGRTFSKSLPLEFYEDACDFYYDSNMAQYTFSEHNAQSILIYEHAYELLWNNADLYDSDEFFDRVLSLNMSKDGWENRLDAEKASLAIDAYFNLIQRTQYELTNPYGKNYSDFQTDAIKLYMKTSGNSLSEYVDSLYLSIRTYEDGNEKTKRYSEYKIVGLFSASDNSDVSQLVISDSLNDMYESWRVENGYGKEIVAAHAPGIYAFAIAPMPTDRDAIQKLVELSYDEDADLVFSLQNQVMDTLGSFNEFIEMGAKIFLYVGIGFAVFSALMLMNFISVSISYKRREIGILRAVGARSSDVFKIFFCEAFIIALINYVLSVAATVTITNVFNGIVRNEGINVTLLHFGLRQVILMLLISVLVAAVASFLPVWNIARRKPVDAIKNK